MMTLKQWCEKHSDARLMAELYADGMAKDEIAQKFDVTVQKVSFSIKRYMPSKKQVEDFKRRAVKAKLRATSPC